MQRRRKSGRNGNNRVQRIKVGITLPEPLLCRLSEHAASERRNVSATVEIALEKYLPLPSAEPAKC